MIGILKGMEGLRACDGAAGHHDYQQQACLYGDGASALVNASGKIEWQKKETTQESWGPGYKVVITMKRRDQSEPVARSFSHEDAQRAKLITKKGPSLDNSEQQCYWRA